jgi:ketosteroid isomerase-like protein
MNKRLSLAISFLAIAVSVFSQTKEEKALIVESIKGLDQKLAMFYKTSQPDSIVNLFSPNCHYAREFNQIVEGRENVLAIYNKDFKSGMKVVSCKFNVIEHKVYDDLVMEIGTQTLEYSIGPDKRLHKDEFNYMLIWKKSKDGKYQIRSAFWNSIKNPCL